MRHEDVRTLLNDYVDGQLTEETQEAVVQHLAQCDICRNEASFLRSLLTTAAGLPEGVAPGQDLWPGIAARIVQGKAAAEDDGGDPAWLTRGMRVAAAVALIAVSSLLTAVWVRNQSAVDSDAGEGGRPAAAALAQVRAFEKAYGMDISELSSALQAHRTHLAPETVRVIEENLGTIDRAIQEAQAALAADPGNQRPAHTILAMYMRKIDLLQQAVRLPEGG